MATRFQHLPVANVHASPSLLGQIAVEFHNSAEPIKVDDDERRLQSATDKNAPGERASYFYFNQVNVVEPNKRRKLASTTNVSAR